MTPLTPSRIRRNAVGRGSLDYPATTELMPNNPFWSAYIRPFVEQNDPQFIGVLGLDAVNANTGVVTRCNRTVHSITDGTSNTMILAECTDQTFPVTFRPRGSRPS